MASEEEITSDSLDTTETDVSEALLDYVRNQVVDYIKETKFSAKIQHTQGQSPKLVLSFGNTAKQNQGSSDTKNTNTICVENLPPTADEDLLEMFFESTKKYGGGPVKEVRMIRDKNIAFVKFCEVSAVETVIKKKPIMLGTTELYVKPYKSLLPYNETIYRVQVEGLLLPKEFTEGLLTKHSEQVPISGSELAVMIKPSRICIKRKLSARSDRVKSVDLHPSEPWMLASLYNGNVHVWNFESQQLIKSFEVCDNPVRNAKFVARKNWILTGSDDMQVRCYNYNTLELVHHFEAHSDYIRCIVVHPTQPFFLTSSDDTFIKCWDWEKKWSCTRMFEGHTHYVMQIAFNPKDNNTFASASFDRSIKVWQLGSCTSNFTLEGHEKGVNCVAYYYGGDKPYLISGADDKTVKIWDYQNRTCIQTLEGHAQNISAVSHHPKLSIILTGSEDGTVKIWHEDTYRHCTLHYGFDRVWTISCQRGSNYVALGYDEGSIMIKVEEAGIQQSKSMLEENKDRLQPEMEEYDLESHTNALPGLNKPFSWAAMASKNRNSVPPMYQKVTQNALQRPSIDSRDISSIRKRLELVGPSREFDEPWVQGVVVDRDRGTRFPDNQQLFVGNLPYNASERELREFFGTYGNVVELRINRQSSSWKVPNFGFVVFNSPDPVQHIISNKPIKFNGEHLLNVEEKKSRGSESRPIGWAPTGVRGGRMKKGGLSRRGR